MTLLDQAENTQGVVSAARKRERWAQAMVKTSNEEKQGEYREAIADLEFRFPEIEDIPPGGAEAFARERGHGKNARSPVHQGRRRPGAAKRAAGSLQSQRKSPQPTAPKKHSQPSRPAATPRSRGQRAARAVRSRSVTRELDRATAGLASQTGIPAAFSSGTSLTMSLLGATIGLSLLYLMLSSAERKGTPGEALPQVLLWVTNLVRKFVAPRDLLPNFTPSKTIKPIDTIPGVGSLGPHLPPKRSNLLPSLAPDYEPGEGLEVPSGRGALDKLPGWAPLPKQRLPNPLLKGQGALVGKIVGH